MRASEYQYESIEINGRKVLISDIVSGAARGFTPFEESTLAFIKEWFIGVEEFTLQTSGSTGAPKSIRFRRWQMEASARATLDALRLRPGMTALVCLDTRYVAGKMMLVRCFVGQMAIIAVEPTANPLAGLEGQEINFTALVPYQLQRIVSSGYLDRLNRIFTVITGGAGVSPAILPLLERLDSRILLTYGMTETLSHIALQHLNGPSRTEEFHTLSGIKISKDDRGCLEINAPYLPEPVVTNDLVDLVSDTSFRWLGRADNVINTGGVKVYPETVENQLESLKSALNLHGRLIVSSLPDLDLGEKVICVIEDQPYSTERKNQLLGALSGKLSKFERPRDIYFVCPFPETETGKIDRTKIKGWIREQA